MPRGLLVARAANGRSQSNTSGGAVSPSKDPPFSSLNSARSVTTYPLTASAGQVAHQFTTPTRSPFSEATFQKVLAPRSTDVAGCARPSRNTSVALRSARAKGSSPVIGIGMRMPGRRRAPVEWMPWASGPRPVAMVVHTIAGTCSLSARRTACAPPARSSCRRGISPRAIIWSAMRRSSPSMPRTRTFSPVGTTAKSGALTAEAPER